MTASASPVARSGQRAAEVRRKGPPFRQVSSVGYFNNIYVAVGGGGTIMTSPDGLTWISRNSATYGHSLTGIAYGNHTLVAVGSGNVTLQSGVIEGIPLVLGPGRLLSGGTALVSINGLVGQSCSIQASTNLLDWLTITNVMFTNTSGHFTDPSASDLRQRFYRAVVQ